MSPLFAKFEALLSRAPEAYSAGLVCSLAGRRFIVVSDETGIVDNAMHYLFPSCDERWGDLWMVSVDKISAKVYEGLLSIASDSESVTVKPGFTYCHSKTALGDVFISSEGFANDPHAIVMNGRRLAVVSPNVTEVIARLPARLIREISLRLQQNQGGCFVHGGAVALESGGVAIMGKSGAGKTTALLTLLRCFGSRFVANDRGILTPTGEDLVFDTWPLGVRIGKGTFDMFPELRATADTLQRSENRVVHDKLALEAAKEWGSRLKYELTPLELCHRFDRQAEMTCNTKAVLLPHLELNSEPLRLVRIDDSARAVTIFNEEITEPSDKEYGIGWLGLRTISLAQGAANKRELIDRLLELPIFELVGDPRCIQGSFLDSVQKKLSESAPSFAQV